MYTKLRPCMATLLSYTFYCTGHIKVNIIREKHLSLSTLLEDVSAEEKLRLLNILAGQITTSVIAIHGLDDPQVQSGLLGAHREWNDKQYIRTILMSLPVYNEKELTSCSRVYAEEILFQVPDGKQGIHGSLDMMTGSVHSPYSSPIHAAVIINHKGHKLEIRHPRWVEAKSVSGAPLVGGDVKKIQPLTDSSGDTNSSSNTSEESAGASGDGSASSPQPEAVLDNQSIKDINTTAQPIAELLVVAQMQKSEPTILFYMNRFLFRPFIYFKSGDIMLTTTDAYEWNTEKRLNVHGVLLMALLMGALQFKENLDNALVAFGVKPTGFAETLDGQNIYKDATLSSQEFKPSVNRKDATLFTGEKPASQKQTDESFLRVYKELLPSSNSP